MGGSGSLPIEMGTLKGRSIPGFLNLKTMRQIFTMAKAKRDAEEERLAIIDILLKGKKQMAIKKTAMLAVQGAWVLRETRANIRGIAFSLAIP